MADQGVEEGFIFDCFERRHNLEDEVYPINAPTRDYERFIRLFREVARHPTRESFRVPHLPLKSEVSNNPLPFPDLDNNPQPATFPTYFLVSVKFNSKTIYMLHRRYDACLVGLRDANGTWWEFSTVDGQLFHGTSALGVSGSYMDMGNGTGVHIGYYELVDAFRIFANPLLSNINEKRRASQIMIAFSSEAGRSIILANKFSPALTDQNGLERVELGGVHRRIMATWSSISRLIIRNCQQDDGERSTEEAFPNYPDVVHELVAGEMIQVQDAHKAYGLLIGPSDDPEKANTLDDRKGKSKVSSLRS